LRTLRFTWPLPVSGSSGTVTTEAKRRVGPSEANVAHNHNLAKCIGISLSTRE